jgi:hypothetical protein
MAVKVKAGGGGHHRALEERASVTPAQTPDNTSSSELPADYPLHPITRDYDDLTDEETAALRESLRAVGQLVEVVIWKGQIVDGRHRAKLCKELGHKLKYHDIGDVPEDEMRRVVRALNEHRRARTTPLTNEEKRQRTVVALTINPKWSNRKIAEMVGVSHTFVAEVREQLVSTGNVASSEKTVGKDGKSRSTPAKPEPPPLPDVEAMSLKDVQAELQSPAPTTPERKQQLWQRLDALGKSSVPANVPSADAEHDRAERVARASPPAPSTTKSEEIIEIASRVKREITRNDVVTLCNWAIVVAQRMIAANRIGGGR